MRTVIVVLLVAMGFYVDFSMKKLVQKEQEKNEVFRTTIRASHHILNNVIHALYLAKMEADTCKEFDRKVILMCEAMLADATQQVKELDKIDDISCESIEITAYSGGVKP